MSQSKSYEEIREELEQENEHIVELDRLPKQHHNWIDRGLVISCEDAGHPTHRVFKHRTGPLGGKKVAIQ